MNAGYTSKSYKQQFCQATGKRIRSGEFETVSPADAIAQETPGRIRPRLLVVSSNHGHDDWIENLVTEWCHQDLDRAFAALDVVTEEHARRLRWDPSGSQDTEQIDEPS